ncbi:MAG: DNA-binding response regulator [Deltaproteobacteria bacterium HGW-Deltaproteobacteria-22]|nr:MAG: DNA-binding response regulator [Deltaproteobacteria bacterium HGW-Deltaproteobacteria-22]
MMKNRLLLIEDEINLQNSLAYLLEREGFTVDSASTGEQGLELARVKPPDLVLLDVNLPGIDGFETARRLRSDPLTRSCLIIMLTARAHPDDIVQGLSSVADDYVTKPFLPRVLLARIAAHLRRAGAGDVADGEDRLLRFDSLTINQAARDVRIDAVSVKLTPTEYDILVLLAAHPNRVFTRSQIIDQVRGNDFAITDRVVDYQISGLRKKLGGEGQRIETVHGVGYKFQGTPGA